MFAAYTWGHPYFGQSPDINPEDVEVLVLLDICNTTALSLMPVRTVDALMAVMTVTSLMPVRSVEPYCAPEDDL